MQKSSKVVLSLKDVVLGTLIRRPSALNKSPYVGDAMVNGREALVHVPSLDLGGEMKEGTVLAMIPATDRKGNLVGAN
jgi:hypothetical protein